MAVQNEEAKRRRFSQPNKTSYTRLVPANWATTNPQTISARSNRLTCSILLEVGAGGTVRVATGGEIATATNGALLDSANSPFVATVTNTGTISIYASTGNEEVTVEDQYIDEGTL